MNRNLLALVALTALFGGASAAASAQAYPAPYVFGPGQVAEIGDHHVEGVVHSFDRFHMTVRVHGDFVRVQLHQGTIIDPTGLTLQPGMLVRVNGYWGDGRFHADRIVLVR